MGIFDKVRMARETYRQDALRKATTQHLQNKLDLEDIKAQRASLEVRQSVATQLRGEQRAVRDLRHPLVAKVRERIKEGSAAGIGKLKAQAAKNRAETGSVFKTKQTVGDNPFASLGNNSSSPFAPQNVHKLTGKVNSDIKKVPRKTRTVIVYR